MKKVSIITVIALLFLVVIFADTDIVDFQSPVVNTEFSDSICFQCYEDSILLIIADVYRNIAMIDSISRRVYQNTQTIIENNRTIDAILYNCSVPDTVYIQPREAVRDTVVRDIQVRRRIND